jgi:hypothetical protein
MIKYIIRKKDCCGIVKKEIINNVKDNIREMRMNDINKKLDSVIDKLDIVISDFK